LSFFMAESKTASNFLLNPKISSRTCILKKSPTA
jgi:hypothetical protein